MKKVISHKDAAKIIDLVREVKGDKWQIQWAFYEHFSLTPSAEEALEKKLNEQSQKHSECH